MRFGWFLSAALVVSASVLLASCGAGTVDGSDRSTVEVVVDMVDGGPAGGAHQVTVSRGDTVRLVINSESDGRVHIHGYELWVELDDGGGSTEFEALIPGVFRIELEKTGRQLVKLTVS